jgi:hypothetical protein
MQPTGSQPQETPMPHGQTTVLQDTIHPETQQQHQSTLQEYKKENTTMATIGDDG